MLISQTANIENNNLNVLAGETIRVFVTFTIPDGYHVTHQEYFFGIETECLPGIKGVRTIFPATESRNIHGDIVYYGTISLIKEISTTRHASTGENEIILILFYQLCDDYGTCHPPNEIELSLALYMTHSSFLFFTIFRYLIFALIGGLILNLMPCVLPVLSVKAFGILNRSQASKKEIFYDALMYMFGIIFSFILLATLVTILKYLGSAIGWGFQYQNPTFTIFLISLMFVFSLSLFDVFTVRVPGMNLAAKSSGKKGYLGSFMTGIFAVLLALPCTAPFLGAAVGFAFAQTTPVIFAVFISIGIGLGLPFFLIGLFPKTIRLLPKPGEWMNTLKVILGFGLLAFAIYMVSWLITSPQAKFVVSLMHFLLVLSFAVWLYGRFVTPMHKKITQVIISILAILIIIAGANFILKTHILSESETETLIDDFWNIFSEEVLEIAVYENRPVFINFTAAWCSQCRINERVVLSTYEVRQAFTDRNTLMLKADFTRHCPVILNRLQLHGRAGVPLYLLFIPGEPEPIRLPEILTNRLVLNALEQVAIPNYIGDYYE